MSALTLPKAQVRAVDLVPTMICASYKSSVVIWMPEPPYQVLLMRRTAAAKIDKGIGKCQPQDKPSPENEGLPTQTPDTRSGPAFEPYKGKRRRGGEGCLSQISEHLWMGKYSPKWPDGKKLSRSVYAGTSGECEEKLAKLIQQMKLEIAEAKQFATEGKWDQVVALAGQKKAKGARGIESGHQEKTTTV